MLVALSDIGAQDTFDYCIIGAGPAGITLALALAKPGKRIILLEGGGRTLSFRSQDLYRGKSVGDAYYPLETARLRFLGGSSNHWGGMCRPLDDIDFQAKPGHEINKWPISRADLAPYLARTCEILEIPVPPAEGGDLPTPDFKTIHFVYSSPVRFGEKFLPALKDHASVALVLEANVTGFSVDAARVTGVQVRAYNGPARTVRASRYVLATGGIENSRILLWSNEQTGGQTVKDARTLGRYWMDHPTFTIGEVLFPNGIPFKLDQMNSAHFAPTPQMMRRRRILNAGLRLYEFPYRDVKKMVANIACVAPAFGEAAAGLLAKKLTCGAQFRSAWEGEPQASNRIELGKELDAMGMPRVVLTWKKCAADHETIATAATGFGAFLAGANIGRARLDPWVLGKADYPVNDERVGFHHMGGTRMADSPENGVVDANCKVFGQDNLYVAGSSVFPSSGHANPTTTIIQLALRLADHLSASTI